MAEASLKLNFWGIAPQASCFKAYCLIALLGLDPATCSAQCCLASLSTNYLKQFYCCHTYGDFMQSSYNLQLISALHRNGFLDKCVIS